MWPDRGCGVRFRNRVAAGRHLAGQLSALRRQDIVVLGVPRGGVAVAVPVAAELDAPFDVLLVRKLGVPFQPELAMGAVGEGGVGVVNERARRLAQITADTFAEVEARERTELDRQSEYFRGPRPPVPLAGRTAVVVDDGMATGSTARAACRAARARGAARVVLAVPVASRQAIAQLRADADEVVCLESPERFVAIGQYYDDYHQISDAVVKACLEKAARQPHPAGPPAGTEAGKETEMSESPVTADETPTLPAPGLRRPFGLRNG